MVKPLEWVPRSTVIAALALGVSAPALIILALAVGVGPLPVDEADDALARLRDLGAGASILSAADVAGSLPIWAAVTIVIGLVIARNRPRAAVELAVVSLLAESAATLVKIVVGRPRPVGGPDLDLLVAAGYPSGHVTRAAVLVGVVLVLVPWCARRPRLMIVAGLASVALMGVARVSARAHHMSDVLGACLLAAALLAAWEFVRSPRLPSAEPNVGSPDGGRRAGRRARR